MRHLHLLSALALLLLTSFAQAAPSQRLVAVLPIAVRDNALTDTARETIEEAIRTTAGDLLTPAGFTVLTGDNTLKLLGDNGIDLKKACEASCALEAARELKAELFLSGSIAKLEGEYVLFVRLFEQSSGKQLSSVQLEQKTIKELRTGLREKADQLFAPVLKNAKAAPAAVATPPEPPTTSDAGKLWEPLMGKFEISPDGEVITLYTDGGPAPFAQGHLEYKKDLPPKYEVTYSVRRLTSDSTHPQEFSGLGPTFAITDAQFYWWESGTNWTGWQNSAALHTGWNEVRIRQNGSQAEAWINGEPVKGFTIKQKPANGRVGLFIKGAPGQVSKVQYRNFKLKEL